MKNSKSANELVLLVGENIRKQRWAKKFSQEAFADYIGLDRSNYGAIERGQRNISVLTLARIAEALEIDVADLVPNRNKISKILQKIFSETK
jgi:transcriptional regulator with XRE-family HTH domain